MHGKKGLLEVLTFYSVHERFLNAAKIFDNEISACSKVDAGISEWFDVNVCQCCVMLSWLFTLFIGGALNEVRVR